MAGDEDLEPYLGKMRAKGKAGRPFLSRVLAASNLARGGAAGAGRRRSNCTVHVLETSYFRALRDEWWAGKDQVRFASAFWPHAC